MDRTPGGQRTQWKQWTAGITATLTMVSVGAVYGWMTTSLSRLMAADSPIVINSDQSGWMISFTALGCMIGPFIGAACADIFGRKKALLMTSLFYATGWLIHIFATTAEEFYVARVILGTGIGISYTTDPLYVSEVADLNIRGALGTLIAMNVFTGSVFTCTIGPYVAVKTLSMILLMVPIFFVCLFVWFPETPSYLVSKKRYLEAAEALAFFKGISDKEEVKRELELVISNSNNHSNDQNWLTKLREMLLPNNLKALGIIVALILTQVLSGSFTIMVYLEVLFQKANINIDTNLATVIVLVTGLLSSALATVTIEKFGRRPLLMTSTLGTTVTLAVLASYLIADSNGVDMTSIKWLPLLMVILFQITDQLGIGAVPEALIGELFPTNVSSIGSAAATVANGLFGVMIAKLYQVIGDAAGEYAVYYIYSGSCLLGFIFTLAYLPETKNKEIDEIQKELTNSSFRCLKKRNRIRTSLCPYGYLDTRRNRLFSVLDAQYRRCLHADCERGT